MLKRGMRAGLFVDDGALGFAALTSSGLTFFRHHVEDVPGAGLRGELDNRSLRARGVGVGLRRARVLVKILELPAASARGDLGEMVGFELERHVPFAPEDMAWSWTPIPGPKGGTVRVLVAACERRAVEHALRILEESRVRPLSVTVACHDLPALLARDARPTRAVWAHRASSSTDLLLLAEGRVLLSRTVGAAEPEALAAEVRATAALLRWPGWDALWVSGDDAPRFLEAPELGGPGVPASAPPWAPAVANLLPSLPPDETGIGILAVAVALGPRRAPLDLLPADQRPRRLSAGQVLTVATTGLAVLLAVGLFWADARRDQRYLERLNRALRALDPEVRAVEQIKAETAQKQRLLAAIRAAEQNSLRPLPLLRELTETIPQDAWVSALSVDGKGVEITGQAGAANQLIPLLDGSRWLDRVEFTSPVTRGRDKEQFRLKATWEVGPRGPAGAVTTAAATASPPVAAPGPTPAVPAPPGADSPLRPARPGAPPAPSTPAQTPPPPRNGETRPGPPPAASATPRTPPPARDGETRPGPPPAASAPPQAPAPGTDPPAAPATPAPAGWGRGPWGVPR
jgi:Tfp pilus assembly protein PilN